MSGMDDDKKPEHKHVTFQLPESHRERERSTATKSPRTPPALALIIFSFPMPGLNTDQRSTMIDYAWVQSREFRARKLEFVDDVLKIYISPSRGSYIAMYREILDRLNSIIVQKFNEPRLQMDSAISTQGYSSRIQSVPRESTSSSASALSLESAPRAAPTEESSPVEPAVLRTTPVEERVLERIQQSLTTGQFADNFVVEQNSKRLKITIRAANHNQMSELKRFRDEAIESAHRAKRVCRPKT